MSIIGITGGIGSGKSVVSQLMQTYGIPVYIADDQSKILLQNSSIIRNKLIFLLGEDIYTGDLLNRQMMASLIFNDAQLLKKVNNIIHPEVARDFNKWVKKQNAPITVLESAILFESSFNQYVDISLLVCAPLEIRIERVIKRDKVTKDEVLQRIQNQWPDNLKKQYADIIINNDGHSPLIPQIDHILYTLQNKLPEKNKF